MLKGYKKSYLTINIILSILFVFLIFDLVFLKNSSYLFCILSLLVPFSIILSIYGYEKKKRRFTYELLFYVFAYSVIYLLVTYMSGIFIGFTKNIYKFNFSNIVNNVIPYTILIIISEFFRYEIIRKGDGSPTSYVSIAINMVLIDLVLFLNVYDLNTGDGQIKYICSIMLPSVFKNAVMIHFSKLSGPASTILYRLLFDLKTVWIPIFPNFGLYFDCTLNCILPVMICVLCEIHIARFKRNEQEKVRIRDKNIFKYLIIIMIFIATFSINILASRYFSYSLVAIGSGSMAPKIEKGDSVIYKKIDSKTKIKEGEILVFKHDNRIIVHRIIEIVDIGNGEYVYYTKGDANEAPDGFPIEHEDLIGIVKLRIKYIGIPSVILGELLT